MKGLCALKQDRTNFRFVGAHPNDPGHGGERGPRSPGLVLQREGVTRAMSHGGFLQEPVPEGLSVFLGSLGAGPACGGPSLGLWGPHLESTRSPEPAGPSWGCGFSCPSSQLSPSPRGTFLPRRQRPLQRGPYALSCHPVSLSCQPASPPELIRLPLSVSSVSSTGMCPPRGRRGVFCPQGQRGDRCTRSWE